MSRSLITVVAVLLVLLAPSAGAATLKIATVAPDGTVWMKKLRAAGEQVAQTTEGRVKFKFYPGGVMGDASTVRRKMRVGQLHGGAFTGGDLAEVHPDYFLPSLPFLFRDQGEVDAVRSQLDEPLAAGLREAGLELLGQAGGGFVYLMSDRPLRTTEELVDARVWVPHNDPLSEMALRRAGVTPIPLPLADVYTGLQTGVINAAMNTEVGAIAFQWHTKIKYVVDIPVAYVIGALALDRRAFDKLSAADQGVVKSVFEATFAEFERINRQDNKAAREALKKQGIQFLAVSGAEEEQWLQVGDRTLIELRDSNRFKLTKLDFMLELLQRHRSSLSAEIRDSANAQ